MHNKLPLDPEILKHLYNQGQSLTRLSKTLNCSIHKAVYWMRKYNIKRRSRSDAAYLDQNPQGDPFLIKENLTPKEEFLKGLGLGIFWGEGTKKDIKAIKVANCDPDILKTFQNFLIFICGAKKEKIKYSIVCFNDSNPNSVADYWSKQLKTSKENFGKIVQIPPQGKGNYKKKSKFGVCTIGFYNIKLRLWIENQINNLKFNAQIV